MYLLSSFGFECGIVSAFSTWGSVKVSQYTNELQKYELNLQYLVKHEWVDLIATWD